MSSVECYAGHTYPQRPRALLWQGRRLEVTQIERRWRTPVGLHFRVRTGDGRRFDLAYHEARGFWLVEEIG